jgi:hypothetical protein
MKTIKHKGIDYATIGHISEAKKGWNFCEDADSPLQWGVGLFYQGEKMAAHFHKSRPRLPVHKTKEFIYVAKGSVMVQFYDSDKKLFCSETLLCGGYVYFDDGTHGIRVLEQETILIEVKNGAFSNNDKERI